MKAALLISHGSRLSETKKEVGELTQVLKRRSGLPIFEYAFLELESPDIPEGIDLCVKKGATDITILLNFLNSGKHVNFDIPKIVKEAKEKYPHATFRISPPIGQHPQIIDLFLNLVNFSS